jgi:hypothetical protein
MAAKRERGECFHCTEKYSRAHAEVCQPKGVFLLQMDNESPSFDADTEEDPRVSLHAITGLSSTETMQLEVRLNDHTIDALVDSGSTHSFISVTAACTWTQFTNPSFTSVWPMAIKWRAPAFAARSTSSSTQRNSSSTCS